MTAYNLELFGGRFHSDFWVRGRVGRIPGTDCLLDQRAPVRPQAVLVAAGCFMLTHAQRHLSTPVRELRHHTISVSGRQHLANGTTIELDAQRLAVPFDDALRACAVALALLGAGLIIARL